MELCRRRMGRNADVTARPATSGAGFPAGMSPGLKPLAESRAAARNANGDCDDRTLDTAWTWHRRAEPRLRFAGERLYLYVPQQHQGNPEPGVDAHRVGVLPRRELERKGRAGRQRPHLEREHLSGRPGGREPRPAEVVVAGWNG